MKRVDAVCFILVLSLMLALNVYQAHTIEVQGHLIQQMMTNPACNGRQ